MVTVVGCGFVVCVCVCVCGWVGVGVCVGGGGGGGLLSKSLNTNGRRSPLLILSSVAKVICRCQPSVKVGMSSLFINLILKPLHYFHRKALNERVSKWAHLSFFYHLS